MSCARVRGLLYECAGLLEHTPATWLQLLFRALGSREKLDLFRASKQAARLVTRHCLGFRLMLKHARDPRTLTTARQAITQLIGGLEQLAVQLDLNYGPQPFPDELAPCIHKLILQGPAVQQADQAVDASLDFDRLTAVTELCLGRFVSEPVLISLSTALEAGHMPNRRHFTDNDFSNSVGKVYPHTLLQRLASALGGTVSDLHLQAARDDKSLISYLHLVSSLRSLELSRCCRVSKQVICQLCEHPTLHSVTMRNCNFTSGEGSDFSCRSWKNLTIEPGMCNLYSMLGLPLRALQTVRLRDSYQKFCEGDALVVSQLLALGDKLTWSPHPLCPSVVMLTITPTATCQDLVNICIPLLRTLTNPYQPCMALRIFVTRTTQTPGLLPTVWKYIPSCVTCLEIRDVGLFDDPKVWQGMPAHKRDTHA